MKKTLVLAIVAGVLLAGAAMAESVPVGNFSFELPGTVKQENWENVPNWNSDTVAVDSGVETGGYFITEGQWQGFLMQTDPSVYNLTDCVIAADELFTLTVDAGTNRAGGVYFQMDLYYDNNGSRVRVATQTVTVPNNGQTNEFSLSFSANNAPESIGHRIGIELNNTGSAGSNSWMGMDNIRLSTSAEEESNLIGYWKFNEGSGSVVNDYSGQERHGEVKTFVEGGAVWTAGRFGNALDFDGTDDFVDAGSFPMTSRFTVSVWLKSPQFPQHGWPTVPVPFINWNHTNPDFRGAVQLQAAGQWYSAGFGTLQVQTWYHLAGTYDGESLKAYKNGVLITNNEDPSGNPNGVGNPVDLLFCRSGNAHYFHRGIVDEIRYYNRALTLSEVESLFAGETGGTLTNGLTGYWNLNEGSDFTVADLSSNGNTGILTTIGTNTDVSWTTGEVGGAIDLNGEDEWVDAGSFPMPDQFTVAGWIRSPEAPKYGWPNISVPFIHWDHSNPDFRGAVQVQADGQWYAAKFDGIQANEWSFYVGTYDGNYLKAYKNGNLCNSVSVPGTPDNAGDPVQLIFGRNAPPEAFFFLPCQLDEVRYYDRALSAQEVTDLFVGSTVPKVIYTNDGDIDVYAVEYTMALASAGEIDLVGIIADQGAGCVPPEEAYQTPEVWEKGRQQYADIIGMARRSGMVNIPDPVAGAGWALDAPDPRPGDEWPTIEDTVPRDTPGSQLIVQEANNSTPANPLYIVTGGALTCAADAYLLDNTIADKVVVLSLMGDEVEMGKYNGTIDPWAAYIVLEKFRYYQTLEGDYRPTVTKDRLKGTEIPESELKRFMVNKCQFANPDNCSAACSSLTVSGDSTEILYLMLDLITGQQTFAVTTNKVSFGGWRFISATYGNAYDHIPGFQDDPDGTATIIELANQPVGTDEWWRAMKNTAAYPGTIVDQSPFTGVPVAVPGTIQVEDFDWGGKAYRAGYEFAYHKEEHTCWPLYRVGSNGFRCSTLEDCSDGDDDYNMKNLEAGEWWEYTIDVSEAGEYDIALRIASDASGGQVHLEFDGVNKTGVINIPNSGGLQNWQRVLVEDIDLEAGEQVMRFCVDSGEFNITYISISQPNADINDDGKVNIEDFAVLASWWDDENACSSPGWCGGVDFDMSGTVDMLDLAYFVENWLR